MRKTNCFVAAAVVALAVPALSALGCGTIESEEVDTRDLWAEFMVDHEPDDRVVAWARFRTGGPMGIVVDLTGGEYVECNGTRLEEWFDPITDFRWHRATVPLDPNGHYVFNLVRLDETITSDLTMCEVPFITGTDPVGTMNYTDSLTIYWDTTYPADGVQINFEGDCINSTLVTNLPDSGEYTIDRITAAGTDTCVITVTVIRKLMGLVNFDFEGGYTQANREDATDLVFEGI
jgi:hypothetical protein